MISILTASYNNECYIREFINSVLSQTYTDWELVFIDDGSTDNTKKIIDSYLDSRIHYIYKEHTNLPSSLNVGYNYCKGDYIARADADDIMFPDRLEWQFNFMESHPDVDMQANCIQVFKTNENGKIKKIGLFGNISYYPTNEDILKGTCLCHGSWIVRGSTWRRDKIYYDEDYYCGQDFEYMLNCVAHGWVLYNNMKVTMWRRIHDKCITVNHKTDIRKRYEIAREKYKDIILNKN